MEKMTPVVKKILENSERYKNFTILQVPIIFKDLFPNEDFDVIQLHSIQTVVPSEELKEDMSYDPFVGFCGQCRWQDKVLFPLDGDTYTPNMPVFGYERWSREEKGIKKALDILVGEEW